MLKNLIIAAYMFINNPLSALNNCTNETQSAITNQWIFGTVIVQDFLSGAQVVGALSSFIAENIYYHKALENTTILSALDELRELRDERQKLRDEEPKIILILLKKLRALLSNEDPSSPALDEQTLLIKLKKIRAKIQEKIDNKESTETVSL